MNEQLIAKYLGCFGGGYKFENASEKIIIFKRCDMDFVRKYGLWTEINISKLNMSISISILRLLKAW